MPVTVIATMYSTEENRDDLLAAVCAAVPGVLKRMGAFSTHRIRSARTGS